MRGAPFLFFIVLGLALPACNCGAPPVPFPDGGEPDGGISGNGGGMQGNGGGVQASGGGTQSNGGGAQGNGGGMQGNGGGMQGNGGGMQGNGGGMQSNGGGMQGNGGGMQGNDAGCVEIPGIISWWDGDEVSGTTVSDIQSHFDATSSGDVSQVPGSGWQWALPSRPSRACFR